MTQEMSFQPTDPSYEQRVRASFAQQPFMEFLGAQFLTVRPGRCEIALSYKEELSQQHGFFHAGIIGTIAAGQTKERNACYPEMRFSLVA